MRILVAEDDPSLTAAVVFALRTLNSYAVDCVRDGESALKAMESASYSLLVLDLGLPRLNGFEVLRRLRAKHFGMPVLIMSGRDSPNDKIKGLDLGADDYVVKPFSVRELEARVRALLRRSKQTAVGGLSLAGLAFDPTSRTATYDGRVLPLSAREVSVLELLMKEFGRVVTKEKLIAHLYCTDEAPGPNAIEVFIHRLRKKLSPSPFEVRTHHGVGYQLDYREH